MSYGICMECSYGGLSLIVDFKNKINILVGNSATGKTVLLDGIRCRLNELGVKCSYVNYKNRDIVVGDSKVLLLDNADLYLTDDVLYGFSKQDITVVAVLHNFYYPPRDIDAGIYICKFEGKVIRTVRW